MAKPGYIWDGSSWVQIIGQASTDLDSLSDVVITSVSGTQFLQYDSGTSKWINRTLSDATAQAGGVMYFYQPAPTAKTSTSVTLTIAELLTGIITTSYTGSSPTYTLPTGTLTDAGILSGALPVDRAFDWFVQGIGGGSITIGAGTNHTIVGSGTILSTAVAAGFRTRKTATNTFVTYRIS
jgi:hypothetical protein